MTLPKGWAFADEGLPPGWSFDAPDSNYLADKARRFGRAVPEAIGDTIAGVGSAGLSARTLLREGLLRAAVARGDLTPEEAEAKRREFDETTDQSALVQAAKAIQEVGGQVRGAFPQIPKGDPARDEELGSAVASGAASVVPILATGGLGRLMPAAAAGAAGSMAGESARRDAAEHGGSEAQQAAAFALNAPVVAASEAAMGVPALLRGLGGGRVLPQVLGKVETGVDSMIAQAVGKLLPAAVPVAQQLVKNAVREGVQEGIEQIAGNVIAKDVVAYDPERTRTEGLGTAMAAGAIVGGGLGAGGKALEQALAPRGDTGRNIGETEATLRAQQQQLIEGRRPAQMFPVDEQGRPQGELPLPEGMERVETPRGVFHFDPRQIDARQVRAISEAQRENLILGLGRFSKAEVEQAIAAGDRPVAVTERTADGTEVRTAASAAGLAPRVAAEMQATATPGSTVQTEPIERVPQERAQARGGLIDDLLAAEAKRMEAQRAEQAREVLQREQRQRELAEKRARFDERVQTARAVMANPEAAFAEVQGALESMKFYAEDNSLGLDQAQRQLATRAQLALARRLDGMQAAEQARRDAEAAARAAAAKEAEARAKAERKAEQQRVAAAAQAGIGASGAFDYETAPIEALEQRAEQGDDRAVEAISRRMAQEGDSRETLLDALRSVKLPATDAALGTELRQLITEGMTERQRMTLVSRQRDSLDQVAEALRERGFAGIETPADVLDAVGRALAGEDIRAERAGDAEVEFATGRAPEPDPRIDLQAYRTPTGYRFATVRGIGSKANDAGVAGKGPYHAPDTERGRRVAAAYAGKNGRIERGAVELKNPLVLAYSQLNALQESLYGRMLTGFEPELSAKFDAWMRAQGYDGAVLFDLEISATEPAEIVKLAPPRDGNQAVQFATGRRSVDEMRQRTMAVLRTSMSVGAANDVVEFVEQGAAEPQTYLPPRLRTPENVAVVNALRQAVLEARAQPSPRSTGVPQSKMEAETEMLVQKLAGMMPAPREFLRNLLTLNRQQAQREFEDLPGLDEYWKAYSPNAQNQAKTPADPVPDRFGPAVDAETKARRLELYRLFRRLAASEDAWKFGKQKTTSQSLADVVADYSTPDLVMSVQPLGTQEYQINWASKKTKARGQIYVEVKLGRTVQVNATDAGSNERAEGGGKQVYQAIFTWAHNNRYRVVGTMLSRVNELRRTVNMLSSALRHNSTDHLIPYSGQDIKGWIDEDTENNIGAMLEALSRMVAKRAPQLSSLTYDPATDTIVDQNDGRRIKDSELAGFLKSTGAVEQGIGPATGKILLLARAGMAANGRGQGLPAAPAIDAPRTGSLRGALYARGAGPGVARSAAAAAPGRLLTEAEVEREIAAIRRAFPELVRDVDVQLANVERALRERGFRGQVPPEVQAAVMRQRARRTLIVLGTRAYRDRAKGASLLTHEIAHVFWDTLPAETQQELRALHAKEVRDKTGPLYRDGRLQTELQFVEDMDENGHKEWFAERVARLNEDWAKQRLDTAEASVLRRVAHQVREWLRGIWRKLARRDGIDPESDLFVREFRRFFASGADAAVGRAAGAAYAQRKDAQFAQSLLGLDVPAGIDLPTEIRNLAPRWQDKRLEFESTLDKALYYAGGANTETRERVVAALASQTGLSPARIASAARSLREKLAPLARSTAADGIVRVPPLMRKEIAAATGVEFATGATPDPREAIKAKQIDLTADEAMKATAKQWEKIMPAFQGGKYQMAEPVAAAIARTFSDEQRQKIRTVVDYFGGGGMWGGYLILTHFPNVERLVVFELEPRRAAKIRMFHESGDQLGRLMERSEIRAMLAEVVAQANADAATSGTAIAARLRERLATATDADQKAVIGTLYDAAMSARGRAEDEEGTKTAEASMEKLIGIAIRDANDAHAGATAMRARGITIEVRTGNSYATQPEAGDTVLSVMDPPYYLTTGYDNRIVGIDIYRQTDALVRRNAEAGNAIIYTDAAWHLDHPERFDTENELFAFTPDDHRALGNIVDSLNAVGTVALEDRHEFLGINLPGHTAGAAAVAARSDDRSPSDGSRRGDGAEGTELPAGPQPELPNATDAAGTVDAGATTSPATAGSGSAGTDAPRPVTAPTATETLQQRFDTLRAEFDALTAEADQLREELAAIEDGTVPDAEVDVRVRRDQIRENEKRTRAVYAQLDALRRRLDEANPTKPTLLEGATPDEIIAQAARVDALPKVDRRQALLDELQRGRDMAAEGNRTDNDEMLAEGTRITKLARERLDDEYPGWEQQQTRDAKKQAALLNAGVGKPEPGTPPPPQPEAAGLDDTEASPFGEPPKEMPVRPEKAGEVYGHGAYRPSWLARKWAQVREGLQAFRSSIPELPTFGGTRWAASADRFIREHGPNFYDGIRALHQRLTSSNDAIQRQAEDRVAAITRGLLGAGGTFRANDYARMRDLQERARRIAADGRQMPATLRARLAALQSKLESHPYVIFERTVLMLDLKWRHDNLKDSAGNPIALPSGINIAEVDAELTRLGQRIAASDHEPAIREAVRKHMELVAEVAADLKKRELMAAEALQNPYYFPHLTLEITRGGKTEQRELRPARVRVGIEADFRGYLLDPVGSRKPIETDYVAAMYYHLVQVGAHNVKADAVRQYAKPYDIRREVEARAKELSKARGMSVSWEQAFHEEYAPRGYVMHGADSGDAFPVVTVDRDKLARRLGVLLTSDDLQQQLVELGRKDVRLLPEDLRETLQQGAREVWIVPARVAEALNGVARRNDRQEQAWEKAMSLALTRLWKQWKLFAPWNHIRYEYGNMVADLEKLVSASPTTFRHLPRAARELREFWLGGEGTPELRAALKEGVINTVTASEMGALSRTPSFREFETWSEQLAAETKAFLSAPLANASRLFGRGVLGRTTSVEESAYREGVTRYAKFLGDLRAIEAGARPAYAGAYWRNIEAITDSSPGAGDAAVRKAAAISRATFGDYGDLSVAGQQLRDKLIPFYSWIEINFRYHANLLRNLRDMTTAGHMSAAQAAGAGARAAAVFAAGFTARTAGGIALRLALPYAAIMAWNTFGGAVAGAWDDDEDPESLLSEEDRRRPHIIVGVKTGPEGKKVEVIYLSTALADVLKWFNGPQFMAAAGDVLAGRTDWRTAAARWREQIGPDLLNNLAGGVTPWLKIGYTALAKKSTFPDVLDQRTVPAYDMRRVILGQITDDFVADQIERAINKDYYAARDTGDWARQLVLQVRQRDPQQWAFYEIKDKAADFLAAQTGRKRESSYDAPEQQALRNFRRAIYKGDVTAAQQFYLQLLDYGYTAERFGASIRAQDPLSELPKQLRRPFVDSLPDNDRIQLQRAYRYYARMEAGEGREATLFPRKRGGEGAARAYQAAPRTERLETMMNRSQTWTEDEEIARAEKALRESLRRPR